MSCGIGAAVGTTKFVDGACEDLRRILNVGRVANRSADRETRVRRSAGWPIVQQTVISETGLG
jgi:hypothetical protein